MKTFKKLYPIFLLSGVFGFSVSMFVPFITPYLSKNGFADSTISYMNAFITIAIILLIPLAGKISDRVGRKRIIATAIVLEILSILLLSSFAKNIFTATTAIVLQASMNATIVLSLLSLVEDGLKREKRGFFTGLNESIYSVGIVLGPLAGSFIVARSSINDLFKISLVILSLLIVAVSLLKEEPLENVKRIRMKDFSLKKELKVFWGNSKLRGIGVLGIFMNFLTPVKYVFLPLFVVQELRAPVKYVGIVITYCLFFNLFQFGHGWYCDKKGANKLVILGSIISAIALFGISTSRSLLNLMVVTVIYSLGISLWNTSAWCYMSEIGEKMNKEGEVIGSYSSIAEIGSFTSYLISGVMVSIFGIRSLFFLYGIMVIFGISISLKYFFEKKLPSPLFENSESQKSVKC